MMDVEVGRTVGGEACVGAREDESSRSASESINDGLSMFFNESVGESLSGRSSSGTGSSESTSDSTPSTSQWLCSHPACGRTFTHRHKLNRHIKYHSKPYSCFETACQIRGVAFTLEKDLARHQARHNGRRFFCYYADCSHSVDGGGVGFTRKDNLRRHFTNQHRHTRP